jgi:hypothetical protein
VPPKLLEGSHTLKVDEAKVELLEQEPADPRGVILNTSQRQLAEKGRNDPEIDSVCQQERFEKSLARAESEEKN